MSGNAVSDDLMTADVNGANGHQTGERLLYLMGRPPLKDYLGYLRKQAKDGASLSQTLLAEEWRAANMHIKDIAADEYGWANDAPIAPLPEHLLPLREQLLASPVYQQCSFRIGPSEIGIVELDRLVVYQKHINLSHVERLTQQLGPSPSEEQVFQLCLPLDQPTPPLQWIKADKNTFVFVSPSNDLRCLESTVVEPAQLCNFPRSSKLIAGVAGITVGFGSNFLHVLRAEGRMVLKNGSHRAYALRKVGITHVPCIINHVAGREELRVVGADDLCRNPDLYLKHPRPSLFKDYFDPLLHKTFEVQRKLRQIRVRIEVEEIDVPAL
jgi:hypothetical protein